MMTVTTPRAYTSDAVREILKVIPRTVSGMFKRGALEGFNVGRLWRVSQAALEASMPGERPTEG